MNAIIQLVRFIVGALFIFSGLIKLNDPVGFSFKLDEYFGADVLNLPFLQDYALGIALSVVILEVLLGVALWLGLWRKFTLWLLFAMIIFFTFLTFYSAYFNKVTDCGCFGDAIPLNPWESFGKDVILTVLIVILLAYQHYIQPLFGKAGRSAIMAASLIFCVALAYHVLNHLPVIDFRAFAIGKSIPEGMKSAEELGLQPPKYLTIYHLKNRENGEIKKVDSERYISENWWQKKEWEILTDKTESKQVSDGYEPPIHDFIIQFQGVDETQNVLSAPRLFLMVAYDIAKTDTEDLSRINQFAAAAQDAGLPFVGLSASLEQEVEEFRHEHQTPFPFASADATTLKTIIRSNPGIVMLENGVVVDKWHYNDLPSFEEVKAEHP